jgi:hypothetical protein
MGITSGGIPHQAWIEALGREDGKDGHGRKVKKLKRPRNQSIRAAPDRGSRDDL